MYSNKKNQNRLIFNGNVSWTEEEQSLTNNVRSTLESKHENINKLVSDEDILRSLQTSKMSEKKAINFLQKVCEVKAKYSPLKMGPVEEELINTGFVYSLGRDRHCRPIIVMRAEKTIPFLHLDVEEFVRATVNAVHIFLQHVKNGYLVDGKVESWVVIFDCINMNVKTFERKRWQGFFNDLGFLFVNKSRRSFSVNMSKPILWALKLASAFRPDSLAVEEILITNNTCKEMDDQIDPSQREKRFGGMVTDLEQGCWPPQSPHENFGLVHPENLSEKVEEPSNVSMSVIEENENSNDSPIKICVDSEAVEAPEDPESDDEDDNETILQRSEFDTISTKSNTLSSHSGRSRKKIRKPKKGRQTRWRQQLKMLCIGGI